MVATGRSVANDVRTKEALSVADRHRQKVGMAAATTTLLAAVWPVQEAAAQEEDTVTAPMPPNCSRGEDGVVTCSGLTKDEFCSQHGSGWEDFCYGGGSSGGGGGGSGGGNDDSNRQDDGEDDAREEEPEEQGDPSQECTDQGGEWVDGSCEDASEEEPEGESDNSDAADRCRLGGGEWKGTFCNQPMDQGVKDYCSCWAHLRWWREGRLTAPECESRRAYWIERDPGAVCQWSIDTR